jgi:hypothetical protein
MTTVTFNSTGYVSSRPVSPSSSPPLTGSGQLHTDSGSHGLTVGAIIGIAIGAVIVVAAVATSLTVFARRRRLQNPPKRG